MKSTFCNRYFPKFRNCARLSIVSVSLLFSCSVFAQDANTAAIASDVESILQSLNWALRNSISSEPGYIPERLDDLLEYDTATYKFLTGRTSTTASINYNDKNALPYLLGSVVYGLTGWAPNSSKPLDHSLHGDLTTGNQTLSQLLALLHNISNVVAQSASTVVVSNFVSVTNSGGGAVISSDILAGNPWWATNSAFAMNRTMYGTAFPKTDTPKMYSFPQFMSRWAALLTLSSNPSYPTASQLSKWYNFYGRGRSPSITEAYPYTWFDYMGDWMTSNAVASNSRHLDITKLLRNISNEVSDSSAYIANHLDASLGDSNFYLSNIVHVLTGISPDILAGNPWWATNSGFRIGFDNFFDPPYPTSPNGALSFPEIFSIIAGTHNRFQTAPVYDSQEWLLDSWGYDRWNMRRGQLYTFEDWLADMIRSNLVLQVASNYDSLTATVDRAYSGTDVDEDVSTNSVLASFEDALDTPDTSDMEDSFSDAMDEVDSKLRSVSSQFGGDGDPEIVVIPEFTVGGIHVREYRGSLDTPLTRVAHAVCVFLYTVFFICASVRLIRVEWAFWTTLGHSSEA